MSTGGPAFGHHRFVRLRARCREHPAARRGSPVAAAERHFRSDPAQQPRLSPDGTFLSTGPDELKSSISTKQYAGSRRDRAAEEH